MKIEVIQSMFCGYNRGKLEIDNRKIFWKFLKFGIK